MSVRWRPDCEKWEVSVTISGMRVRERFEKKKDAESRDIELRRLRSTSVMSGMNKPYSTAEAFASYLETESSQKTEKTRKADITFITLAQNFFQNRNLLRDITLEDLQLFQIQCSEKQHWSTTTIALRMKILKAIFKKACATGRIERDPTLYWKVPRGTGQRRRAMNSHEFKALVTAAECPGWLRPILLFMRLTGARGASVAGLKWSDIDFSKAEVLLRSRKGGVGMEKTIPFPMYKELFHLLSSERNKNPNALRTDFVFRDGSLLPVTGHRISSAGHRLIKASGLKGVVIYSLRHALAVDLTEKGISLEITRQLMGHSNVSQTQEYARGIGVETLRDSMQLIRGSDAQTKPDNSEE